MRKVCVAGGGASGLTAAIAAARAGAQVIVLEQKEVPGKKILSTGNGRCNLTNLVMDASCYRGEDTGIVETVLDIFGTKETLAFFESLGICTRNRNGYIYPRNDQASAVRETLVREARSLGAVIETNTRIQHIRRKKQGFLISVSKEGQERRLEADKVILAMGGKAFPVSGSDGSGYTLAKELGHSLAPVVPALVQLKAEGMEFAKLSGVRTEAKVSLYVEERLQAEDTGEVQLTSYGISGIPVFQVSRFASEGLRRKQKVTAVLDFFPEMEEEDFTRMMEERAERWKDITAEEFLQGMFHKKLALALLNESSIRWREPVGALTKVQMKALIQACRHLEVRITGTNSFEQAQVCAGGVRTSEINWETMESCLEEGLYIAGELLDVDGICGGYNLQWAWATGYLAGCHAAR